jgi:hypothetical protein
MGRQTAGRFYFSETVPPLSSVSRQFSISGSVVRPAPLVFIDSLPSQVPARYWGSHSVEVAASGIYSRFTLRITANRLGTTPGTGETATLIGDGVIYVEEESGYGSLWVDIMPWVSDGDYSLDLYVIGEENGGSAFYPGFRTLIIGAGQLATPARSITAPRSRTPIPTSTPFASRTPWPTPTASYNPSYTSTFAVRQSRVRKIFQFSYLIPIVLNR